MKRASLFTVLAFSVLVIFSAGCSNMGENTQKGAVVGGLIGAGAGAIIGQQTGRHPVAGAAIGGSVGALSGGLIGSSIDKKATSAEKLSISDIVLLSKNKISDADIIQKIDATGSVFRLSAEEITMLKNEGISNAVINAMMNTSMTK